MKSYERRAYARGWVRTGDREFVYAASGKLLKPDDPEKPFGAYAVRVSKAELSAVSRREDLDAFLSRHEAEAHAGLEAMGVEKDLLT